MNARLRRVAATLTGCAVVLLAAAPAGAANGGTSEARAGTAGFHNIDKAIAAGYGELTDAAGIACIDKPGVGGMGIHYVNMDLVKDPAEDAATPELVVYEPQKNGRLRLVAVEYVVIQAAWDAVNAAPPSLFGQPFTLTPSPNRYGLPPFYELHAWLWKHNPAGMFEDFNPDVVCP